MMSDWKLEEDGTISQTPKDKQDWFVGIFTETVASHNEAAAAAAREERAG